MKRRLTALLPILLAGCQVPAAMGGSFCAYPSVAPVAHQQGALKATGNPLDWALDGPGYFVLRDPQSGRVHVTRHGAFTLNESGTLVSRANPTMPLEPSLTVPTGAKSWRITADGFLLVTMPGSDTKAEPVGQLNLATFPNPAGLQPVGTDMYAETAAAGCPIYGPPGKTSYYPDATMRDWYATGDVLGGYLEGPAGSDSASLPDPKTRERAVDPAKPGPNTYNTSL